MGLCDCSAGSCRHCSTVGGMVQAYKMVLKRYIHPLLMVLQESTLNSPTFPLAGECRAYWGLILISTNSKTLRGSATESQTKAFRLLLPTLGAVSERRNLWRLEDILK